MTFDEMMMQNALEEAKIADKINEVPVGAVITIDNEIIAAAHNTRESTQDALGHAECNAIRLACQALSSRRLNNATIYVTLEPCPMCSGAIINAGINKVVFGTFDKENGAMGSVIDLSKITNYNNPKIKAGVLEKECRDILSDFFKRVRK